MKSGKAEIVTGHIKAFEKGGVRLEHQQIQSAGANPQAAVPILGQGGDHAIQGGTTLGQGDGGGSRGIQDPERTDRPNQ